MGGGELSQDVIDIINRQATVMVVAPIGLAFPCSRSWRRVMEVTVSSGLIDSACPLHIETDVRYPRLRVYELHPPDKSGGLRAEVG